MAGFFAAVDGRLRCQSALGPRPDREIASRREEDAKVGPCTIQALVASTKQRTQARPAVAGRVITTKDFLERDRIGPGFRPDAEIQAPERRRAPDVASVAASNYRPETTEDVSQRASFVANSHRYAASRALAFMSGRGPAPPRRPASATPRLKEPAVPQAATSAAPPAPAPGPAPAPAAPAHAAAEPAVAPSPIHAMPEVPSKVLANGSAARPRPRNLPPGPRAPVQMVPTPSQASPEFTPRRPKSGSWSHVSDEPQDSVKPVQAKEDEKEVPRPGAKVASPPEPSLSLPTVDSPKTVSQLAHANSQPTIPKAQETAPAEVKQEPEAFRRPSRRLSRCPGQSVSPPPRLAGKSWRQPDSGGQHSIRKVLVRWGRLPGEKREKRVSKPEVRLALPFAISNKDPRAVHLAVAGELEFLNFLEGASGCYCMPRLPIF